MAAEHGGAMAVGGEAEAALPELGRWRKREHNLKEGEAELRARDCRPRWRSRGELRRWVRGVARGRAWGSRLWRRGKAAREGVSERTGSSRCRRARGRGRRPAATRGGVDGAWPPRGGRALPRSARVRAASRGTARGWAEARRARDGVARGPTREVGWRGARQAGTRARPASAVGREAERRPVKRNEILFFLFLK